MLAGWTGSATSDLVIEVDCVAIGSFEGIYKIQGLAAIPQLTLTASADFSFLFGGLFNLGTGITMVVSHNEVHIGD